MICKKNFLFLIIFLTSIAGNCQEISWVKVGAGDTYLKYSGEIDIIYSIAANEKNIYATGLATGEKIKIDTETINKGNICFLLKFDLEGTLIWSKELEGWGKSDVALDSEANILVTVFSQKYDNPSYIRKYNGNGNLLWEKTLLKNAYGVHPRSITVDKDDAIIVAGKYRVVLDTMTVEGNLITGLSNESIPAFLIKYDKNGEFQWFRTTRGNNYCVFNDVKVGANNEIAVFGNFKTTFRGEYPTDSLIIGQNVFRSILNTTNSYPFSTMDVIIAQYSQEGSFNWAKQLGGSYDDWGNQISINSQGEIAFIGTFQDTLSIANTQVRSRGGTDIFFGQFGAGGDINWIKTAGGTEGVEMDGGYEAGRSITYDSQDDIYISGSFAGTAIFGENISKDTVYANGFQVGFLGKYSKEGDLVWVKNLEGGTSTIFDIGTNNSDVFFAGNFYPDSYLNTQKLPVAYPNTNNFFLARIEGVITSIHDNIQSQEDLKVYPNPASESIFIDLSSFKGKTCSVTVFDLAGSKVSSSETDNKLFFLDFSNYQEGLYIIIVSDGNRIYSKKIIKK